MAHAGTATIEVVADTEQARKDLEELASIRGRIPFSLGDAGVVASVLGFAGFLVEKFF